MAKNPVLESLFNKVAVLRACNFVKEDSNFLKTIILKNIFERLFLNIIKKDSNTGVFLWILWIIQEYLFCK